MERRRRGKREDCKICSVEGFVSDVEVLVSSSSTLGSKVCVFGFRFKGQRPMA